MSTSGTHASAPPPPCPRGPVAALLPRRRDLRFDLTPAHIAHWHAQGPQVTHFFNALSLFFPAGERFFIASVRQYRHRIGDAALRKAVVAFIGQEAMHGREHEHYNRLIGLGGQPAQALEKLVERVLAAAQRFTSPSWQLGTTLALEHHTAILAHLLLSEPELLDGSDPAYRRLWQWHALEETEHKGVAFDVWNATLGADPGAYLVRSLSMLSSAVSFWTMIAAFSICMIELDPATRRRPRGYLELAKFLVGRRGMFRTSLPAFLAYFRPSFHPWQQDDRALLEQMDEVTQDTRVVRQSDAVWLG